jgi:hypothetical protein
MFRQSRFLALAEPTTTSERALDEAGGGRDEQVRRKGTPKILPRKLFYVELGYVAYVWLR